MNKEKVLKIFKDNEHVRYSGSKEELACANYFKNEIESLGLKADIEAFEVDDATITKAYLKTSLGNIKCKGYRLGAYTKELTAPLYYLRDKKDLICLSEIKDKIVLMTGYFGKWIYQDLVKYGALAFITTTGIQSDSHEDIDDRELRKVVSKDTVKLPGLNINIKDAVRLINEDVKEVTLAIEGEDYKTNSHNVITVIEGEVKEKIVLTAHYDTVPLSKGIYDNLSGAVGILELIERFSKEKPHFTLEFVLCGSEERGLLGSKAYVKTKKLDDIRLVVNLDMIGCTLGQSIACCTSAMDVVHYIDIMSKELGYPIHAYQDVYSSDSTPFADKGIPAISFARIDPNDMELIHNRYDTSELMNVKNLFEDIDFIYTFTKRMANAKVFPIKKEMPQNMKDELDIYLLRKKKEEK